MDMVLLTKDISVVIPTLNRRPVELATVRAHLTSLGFKDIILAEGDKKMYNRYEAARRAKNDIIYTQDDDCIISNIPDLLGFYDPKKVTANTKTDRLIYYQELCQGKIALVGYGAVFHKSLLDNFKKYTDKFPEDDCFHREADRTFTWLNEKQLILADARIADFPTAMTGMSIDDEHVPSMMEMIERLKQL